QEKKQSPINPRRAGAMGAALALLLAAAGLAAEPPQPWKKLAEREREYLQRGLAQIRRMKGNFDWIGRQPLASGALAAAALAAAGGPDAPRLREGAAGWVTGVLAACPQWHKNECARAQLPLERLVLEYPETLPPQLLARLRQAVANSVPPP